MKKVTAILLSLLMLLSCSMFVVSATEDITADPMTFNLNTNTTDISGADAANSNTARITMQTGQYLEYTVNTEQAAIFDLTFYGSIVTDNATLTVSVNGTPQLSAVPVKNTGGHGNRDPHNLGKITLVEGANVIRIQVKGSATVCTKFTLAKIQDVFFFDVKQANFTEDEYNVSTIHTASGWWSNGTFMIMRGDKNSDNDTWLQKTINVAKSGWYSVEVLYGTAESAVMMQVTVDGEQKALNELTSTGAYGTKATKNLANIYLEAGERTIRFTVTQQAAYVHSITLGVPQDEIINGKWEQKTTPSTIYSHSGYAENDNDLAYGTRVVLRDAKNITVIVYTDKALTYEMTASYGAKLAGATLAVSVNGNKQITAAPADSDGTYTVTDGHHVGYITLNRGMNYITLSVGEGSKDAVVLGKVGLDLVDSFRDNAFTAWVREGAVPEMYFSGGNAGWYAVNGEKCATMRDGSYMVFDVYAEEEHQVNPVIDIASSENISFSLDVNGTSVISGESIGKPGTSYSNFVQVTSPTVITIPAGYSTIKYTQTAGAGNLRSVILEEANVNEAYILDFAVENKDGGRMVYASREGLPAYASVTVRKLGTVDDKYRLITAQYSGKQLIGMEETLVDVSALAHKETKTVRTELILKEEGTTVKGFLFDYETFAPLAEAIAYTSGNIFPESVLDTYVNYQLATDTLNNDGVNYAEYGVHDDTYDIDAIFYDGYNDTKVYAYIGIPKNATADNKVPAMVLLHGGAGRAEISWVKKWNDLGIAAIAMDLYGAGPETDDTTSNKRKVHPYAGMEPWGNTAFLADFENAGMYQTVINVINAHNLLRQNECVDKSRIGITGISWGGVTTTTTMGVDNRFMFAAPVYGCGYLDQSKTGFPAYLSGSNKSMLWDPANFAAKATMPVLYVNGDQDAFFSVNATSDTACVTKDARISIHHAMTHSQAAGDSVQQVYRFAQNMFSGKNTNLKIADSTVENRVLTAKYTKPEGTTVSGVTLYYITTDELTHGGGSAIGWKTVTTYVDSGSEISVNLPDDATYCYASITDNYGDIISTKFMKVK